MLLGGSPLRLFRISERARELLDRWKNGAAVGPRRSAQLLARRLTAGGAFNPEPTSSTLGPADVTVVVPVRDRPEQLDRLLDQLEGEGLACIVVDDASADAGATAEIAERHGAAFVGLASNVGPAGARNAGLAAVHGRVAAFVDSDCVPVRWMARSVAGPLRRPRGRRRGAPHRRRGVPLVARPRRPGRAGAPGEPHPLRAQRGPLGPDRCGPGIRPVRPCAARRRGRGPGLAPARGGLGGALRPVQHGHARGPRQPRGLPDPARLLRDDGRPVEPTARGGRGAGACLRLVAARLVPAARPPAGARTDRAVGVHCRAGSSPARPRARPRRRGDTDRRPRHHPLGAARARLVDAGLGAGLRAGTGVPPDPSCLGPGPRPPRAPRMGGRPAGGRPRACGRRPCGRRRRVRHRRLDRLRPGQDGGATRPPHRMAGPRVVEARPAAGIAIGRPADDDDS